MSLTELFAASCIYYSFRDYHMISVDQPWLAVAVLIFCLLASSRLLLVNIPDHRRHGVRSHPFIPSPLSSHPDSSIGLDPQRNFASVPQSLIHGDIVNVRLLYLTVWRAQHSTMRGMVRRETVKPTLRVFRPMAHSSGSRW
jgi:hypothetical protein